MSDPPLLVPQREFDENEVDPFHGKQDKKPEPEAMELPEELNLDQQDRTLLRGSFSVRKGKTQLHKWAERQVILCGTSLTVASLKDREEGKMHILPLVGGKV